MNEYFNRYADLTALILTLALPLLLTIYLKTKAKKRIRAVAVYFFVFGPSGILSFIFFHLFENSYRAVEAATNGRFAYNFRFYSLILFGLVVAYLGALYLQACFDKCLRGPKGNRPYFYKMLLMLLITVPLIPITPIAAVPAICCSVSILALPFVCRRKFSYRNAEQEAHGYDAIKQPQVIGSLG
jgi:hypothetical protein